MVTNDWSTGFFLFDIGLFQGCVLSSILFDCVFQLLLDMLKPLKNLGYSIKSVGVQNLTKAYADDLALQASTPRGNQEGLNTTMKFLNWTKTMKAKPRKCVALAFKRFHKTDKSGYNPYGDSQYSAFDPQLTIDGRPIGFIVDVNKPKSFKNTHFKFVGRYIHWNLSEKDIRLKIESDFMSDMKAVDECGVKGLRKAWLYQHFVLARIIHNP